MHKLTNRYSSRTHKLKTDESGVASFLVTLVLMLVITLVVLGFAQVARRNQRETLDDQLSTQAYYAAETGVNLVQNLMQAHQASELTKTTCLPSAGGGSQLYVQLNNTTSQVANSCLLVNGAPNSLKYDDVGTSSTVAPIETSSDSHFLPNGTLTISWTPISSVNLATAHLNQCPQQYGTFPTVDSGGWPANCPIGVLRFDIVDVTSASVLDAASLENHTMTVFAPPVSTSSTASKAPIYKRQSSAPFSVGATTCSVAGTDAGGDAVPPTCSLTVGNVNFSGANYLRLTSLYEDAKVTITGQAPVAGVSGLQPVQFINAQMEVDSTGKATDVLRRVQVRLDENSQLAPAYAIAGSQGVCKLYTSTGPGNFNSLGCN